MKTEKVKKREGIKGKKIRKKVLKFKPAQTERSGQPLAGMVDFSILICL